MMGPAIPRQRRGIAGLLGGVGVSLLGTRMSFLALPWFVLTTSGSPAKTGLLAFAEMAPYVTTQALGGPVVDRLGVWRTSIFGDLIAAVAVGLVPLLHANGALTLPLLAGLVAIAGVARGAGDTSRHVLLPGVAEPARIPLERAAGMYDGVNRLAGLVGAPLAGVLVAATSAVDVLAIDAGTFALSALVIASCVRRAAEPTRNDEASESAYLSQLRQGFGHLRSDRLLLGIAVMVLVTNFVDQATGAVLLPVWARQVAHSPVALGLLGGAMGLGAVVGNLVVIWLGPRLPRRAGYSIGFLVAGAPRLLVLAFAGSVSPVLPIVFLGGLGAGAINPVIGAVEYERIPRHLQARVLGTLGAIAWAGIPLGGLAGGGAVSTFGLRAAMLGGAGIYLVTTLAPFVFPSWREMDQRSLSSSDAPEVDGAKHRDDSLMPMV